MYTSKRTESAPVEARWSWFKSPLFGAARSSHAIAPRNGGVTNEAMTRKRTVRRSGMSVRATSQPIGAASRQQIALADTARMSVVKRGSRNAGSVKSRRKFASVKPPDRSEKAKTTSQPMGRATRTQSATAKRTSTAADKSGRTRDVSARDPMPHTLKYLL